MVYYGTIEMAYPYKLLGCDPFTDPRAEDFREKAFSFKDYIMYYVLSKFYDIENKSYKISTNVPCFLPSESSINTFLSSIQKLKGMPNFENEAEKHFLNVFFECQKTLMMMKQEYDRMHFGINTNF